MLPAEPRQPPPVRLRSRLADPRPLLGAELRPPRRDLRGRGAVEAWVSVHHAIRRMASSDTVVFLTDDAVGTDEEENLSHLVRNLGRDALRERIVPLLTLKHRLEYCVRFAERARGESFPGLVLLGGDRHDAIPRCLPHSWQLRERLRREHPGLLLGGWANPFHDPIEQVGFLLDHAGSLDFVLTQVLTHHDPGPAAAFREEVERRGLEVPIFAGVFAYRSARRRTLRMLGAFLPVPEEEIVRDFRERGLAAEEIAAATVGKLHDLGYTRFYVSNLDTATASASLVRIADRAGLSPPGPAEGPVRRRRRPR